MQWVSYSHSTSNYLHKMTPPFHSLQKGTIGSVVLFEMGMADGEMPGLLYTDISPG